MPKVVYIETINFCNAACVMCPNKLISRKRGVMPDAVFLQALSGCEDSGWERMQIFLHKEGEPLLDRKIAERVGLAKKHLGQRNRIGINTNAMLLSKHLSRDLLEAGIDEIFFSVDGIDAESYGKYRINLDYETVVGNIKNFLMLRAKIRPQTKVVMQMLTDGEQSDAIAIFYNQWLAYDCQIYIKRRHAYLDGGHSSFPGKLAARQVKTCEDPERIFVIYIDGNTGLCCWDYNNEYSLGSIFDQSLPELYNNPKANALRKAIASFEGEKISPCNRCARIFGQDIISNAHG